MCSTGRCGGVQCVYVVLRVCDVRMLGCVVCGVCVVCVDVYSVCGCVRSVWVYVVLCVMCIYWGSVVCGVFVCV